MTEKQKPLDKMTVKELREIAMEIPGLTGVHAMKKVELLEIIKKEKGIKEEAPKKKSSKKKQEAMEKKDRKLVQIYRRRINRLKKRTRKLAETS